jgi:hypothetical protein
MSNITNKIINTVNLSYLGKSKTSFSKSLLQFYLVLAAPFLSTLLSGQMQDFVKDSREAKHVLGFITMLMIIIDTAGVTDIVQALIYTIFGYSWFILTTKLDMKWSLIIIGLLVVGFLFDTKMKDKEITSDDDEALFDEDKQKIAKKHYNMKTVIFVSVFCVTLVGSYKYMTKKQVQYGGDFDYSKFLLNS